MSFERIETTSNSENTHLSVEEKLSTEHRTFRTHQHPKSCYRKYFNQLQVFNIGPETPHRSVLCK